MVHTIWLPLLTLWLTACTQGSLSPPAGPRDDLRALQQVLQSQHYVYRRQPLPAAFESVRADLDSHLPELGAERTLAEFQRLLTLIGDGHTYVLPWGADRVTATALPIRLYDFDDGLFIVEGRSSYERLAGSRVISIAGQPSGELMRAIAAFVSRDNEMGVRWIGPILLSFRGFLEAITGRSFPESVEVELLQGGRQVTLRLPFIPFPPMRGLPKLGPPANGPVPRYLARVTTHFWFEQIPDAAKPTLHVQVNQMSDAEGETLADFARRLERQLTSTGFDHVVVDLRHNNGGSVELTVPLLNVLGQSSRRGSRLYVLSGRNTFSAAQIFMTRMTRELRVTVAGECSSSRPNFVGEENVSKLPWSGALVSVSNRYHETIPGDHRSCIEPALRVSLSSADYFSGRDPVLEAVLKDLTTRH